MDEKELRRELKNLANQKNDMLVVIDTLQQVLGRAENALRENKDMYDYVFTTSAKWCMSWKPEKN